MFGRKQMEETAKELNQQADVENARIVEFAGKPHVHIDYKPTNEKQQRTGGDIGVIGNDGKLKRIGV